MLFRCIRYLIDIGFLDPPAAAARHQAPLATSAA
jgi:hypothetical protein